MLREVYQSIFVQEGKPSIKSLWPNFNLTDNLKNQNPKKHSLRLPLSLLNVTGNSDFRAIQVTFITLSILYCLKKKDLINLKGKNMQETREAGEKAHLEFSDELAFG